MTIELRARLDAGAEQLGLSLSEEQATKLVRYVELMNKWNKAYNLTSVRSPEQMMTRHIVDSLAILPFISGKRIIDVGTGPGLPGMPLAIMMPQSEFTLLDSLGKRVRFMKQCVHELNLSNVTPVQSRVEAFDPGPGFDIVLSRAFASLKDMLHWCAHLVDSSGTFMALKGQYPHDEIAQVSSHFHIEEVHSLAVPGLDEERHLIAVKKSKQD